MFLVIAAAALAAFVIFMPHGGSKSNTSDEAGMISQPDTPSSQIASSLPPSRAVDAYYSLWNQGNYQQMYAMLTESMKGSGNYGDYAKAHSLVTDIEVSSSQDGPSSVSFELSSSQGGASGAIERSHFYGEWHLVAINDSWYLDSESITEGDRPRAASSETPPSTAPTIRPLSDKQTLPPDAVPLATAFATAVGDRTPNSDVTPAGSAPPSPIEAPSLIPTPGADSTPTSPGSDSAAVGASCVRLARPIDHNIAAEANVFIGQSGIAETVHSGVPAIADALINSDFSTCNHNGEWVTVKVADGVAVVQ